MRTPPGTWLPTSSGLVSIAASSGGKFSVDLGAARLPWRTPKSMVTASQSLCCEESSHLPVSSTSTTTALLGSCFERYEAFLGPLGGRSFVATPSPPTTTCSSTPIPPYMRRPALPGAAGRRQRSLLSRRGPDCRLQRSYIRVLAFARIENHYFFHRGWFIEGR